MFALTIIFFRAKGPEESMSQYNLSNELLACDLSLPAAFRLKLPSVRVASITRMLCRCYSMNRMG